MPVRVGWIREMVNGKPRYTHAASGAWFTHCGHPTALWPYAVNVPGEKEYLLTGGIGLGVAFSRVARAMVATEEYLRTRKVQNEEADAGDGGPGVRPAGERGPEPGRPG